MIGNFVNDDIMDIRHHYVVRVGCDNRFRHGQSNAITAIAQRVTEIPNEVSAAQRCIVRLQPLSILRYHQVATGAYQLRSRKSESNSAEQLPAADVNRAVPGIIEFYVLIITVTRNGVVHDLVDYNVGQPRRAIGNPRRLAGQRVDLRRAIRRAAARHSFCLSAKSHDVENASLV